MNPYGSWTGSYLVASQKPFSTVRVATKRARSSSDSQAGSPRTLMCTSHPPRRRRWRAASPRPPRTTAASGFRCSSSPRRCRGSRAAYRARSAVTYPPTSLGATLRDCTALLAAEQGVRAISVSLGAFDTHSGQNLRPSPGDLLGRHGHLLATVDAAVSAFVADLAGLGLGDQVVVLVFSEFGRRVPENPTGGTDHGLGSSMLVIGERVHGGVYGDYPSLDALVLEGNLAVHTDFRAVYATILARHLGLDPEPIVGGVFPVLGFLG
jgi:uncharacterized protein (DUF1501 family)